MIGMLNKAKSLSITLKFKFYGRKKTETSSKETLANLNKQVTRILPKVNKIKVRTNNASRDRDKDSKDNRVHKVAGTRTPAPSRDSKANRASKAVKAAWARASRDNKVEWAAIVAQAVPRAEAKAVAWVPDKERTTYK